MKASKENYFLYNKSLKEKARCLRNNPTKAEKKLWFELLQREKLGYQFLRQRPVLYFIADFLCKELMLIIEVDGLSHHYPKQWLYDLQRQQKLEAVGFTVLRFSDEQIMNDLLNVRFTLIGWIEEYQEGKDLGTKCT